MGLGGSRVCSLTRREKGIRKKFRNERSFQPQLK